MTFPHNKEQEDLLRISNLSVSFRSESGTTEAVSNISLHVGKSRIVAVVGESGSGKSVTALSILRLLPPSPTSKISGEIHFASSTGIKNLAAISEEELRRLRGSEIGMVFQEPMTSLNPVFTCGNQVIEAIRLYKRVSSADARDMAIELFSKVHLPDPAGMLKRYPHQLSGGQKQRVMIAMAISAEPSLLICDEPTTALDVTVQRTILDLIDELRKNERMGVLFITHDIGVVSQLADEVLVMYKGKIVEAGLTRQILESPTHPYTKALLACRPARHPKGKRLPVVSDFLETDERSLPSMPESSVAGRTAALPRKQFESELPLQESASNANVGSGSREVVSVKDLNVWFPSRSNILGRPTSFVKAVNGVNFSVYEGETLGIVGESGSGKTTIGRCLLGLIPKTSGSIEIMGTTIESRNVRERRRLSRQIQIVFQDPYSALNPKLTVGSAIQEAMKVHGIGSSDKQRRDKVVELLEKVSLSAAQFTRYPHEFSGGQRQRIVIARALSVNPSFVVCDESVSALDVSVQAQILNLLNDLKNDLRFTTIFISHDLAVVHYLSDRILVLKNGRVEELGDAAQIFSEPKSPYTKRLLESIPG
jgi:peptide/nickel transport system ATP-binding protein